MDDDFDALKREATAWIVRLTSGSATSDEADAMIRWRSLSADHERAFVEAAQLWKNLGPAVQRKQAPGSFIPTRRTFLAAGSLAACAAGVGFGLSEIGVLPPPDALLADYATAIGEQKTVRLPDGSVVTLDGGTSLALNYSDEMRHATLSAGAAFIEVMPTDLRPFSISAGVGRSVTANASFSVNHAAVGVSVECLKGQVHVECGNTTDLVAGETVSYSEAGIDRKVAMDVETAAAWRRGLLIFKDRPLADVVADLNRHRRGKVIIARRDLNSQHVSGVFHLERPEEILTQLEATLQVQPISLIGGVVLLR